MKRRNFIWIFTLPILFSLLLSPVSAFGSEGAVQILTGFDYSNIYYIDQESPYLLFWPANAHNGTGRTGLLDFEGNVVAEPVYSDIAYSGDCYIATTPDKVNLLDMNGNVQWTIDGDTFSTRVQYSEPDANNLKYAEKYITFPLAVGTYTYTERTMDDGTMYTSSQYYEKEYRFVDENGSTLSDGFTEVLMMEENIYAYKEDTFYLLDENAQSIQELDAYCISIYPDYIVSFSMPNGLKEYRLLDLEFNPIYDEPFTEFLRMENTILILTDTGYKIIDTQGGVVKELDDYSNVQLKLENGIYDQNYEKITRGYDDPVSICFVEKGDYNWYCGVIDSRGNEIIPCVFENISIIKGTTFSYASESGTYPTRESADSTHLRAEHEEDFYLFNLSGELLYKETDEDEGEFMYNMGILYQSIYPSIVPFSYNLDIRLDLVLEALYPLSSDAFWGLKDGYYTLYSRDGKTLSDAYDHLYNINPSFTVISKDGKVGVFDNDAQKEHIPCEYDTIYSDVGLFDSASMDIAWTSTHSGFTTYQYGKNDGEPLVLYGKNGQVVERIDADGMSNIRPGYITIMDENGNLALASVPPLDNASASMWPVIAVSISILLIAGTILLVVLRKRARKRAEQTSAEDAQASSAAEDPDISANTEPAHKIPYEEAVETIRSLFRQTENKQLSTEEFQRQKDEIIGQLR